MNRRGICPLNDIYNYCRNNTDPQVHAFMEKAEGDMNPRAQKPRIFAMLNVYLRDPETGECENQIGIATQASVDLLKRNLAHRAGRGDPVLSEEWSDFLYGDVTDPMTGLTAFIRETPLENNPSIKFAGIHFSSRPGYLDGSKAWEIDPNTDEGQSILASRYNIQDTENVTKVSSYEELVTYAIEDGEISYDVIERACSQYMSGSLPARPSHSITSSPATTPAQNPVQAAETPTVSPVLSAVATASTEDANSGEAEAESEEAPATMEKAAEEVASANVKEDVLTPEETQRYEALSAKFKEDPNSLEASELPEYFSLCGKLKVSPV